MKLKREVKMFMSQTISSCCFGIDKVTLPLSYEQFKELFKEVERDYQVEIENENERIYCIKNM